VTMTWLRHPFSLGEKVSRAARRMREPWQSHGRASRANPHPNPSPVGEGKIAVGSSGKLLLLLTLLASLAGPALAVQPDEVMKDPALETRARALSSELRCLVCQNESIDDSEAPLARDIRILIRERIGKGESNDSVRAYLVSRYGDFILLKPPFKPETLLLWLSPVLTLGLGVAAALYARRRAPSATPRLSDEEEARLATLTADDGR
jgi:cytochrome c-type biogenesis protein CcmH